MFQNLKNKKLLVLAAIIVVIAAMLFLKFQANNRLILSNDDTGKVYLSLPLDENKVFSISFIHSVNKTSVTDYYFINDKNEIILDKTEYYDFGAGVPFDLNSGEELEFLDNGAMLISNINRKISPYIIYVGTVSDHILTIGDSSYSLRDICGKNSRVLIQFK